MRLWEITTGFLEFIPWLSLVLRSIVIGWILRYQNWTIVFSFLNNISQVLWSRDAAGTKIAPGQLR